MSDMFEQPYHDVDEWRDGPVRHRYVHGGFKGTNARFSFYLPPAERWGGRFVQPDIGGMGGNEKIAQTPMADLLGSIPFAVSLGAYLVESNQGHRGMDMDTGSDDPDVAVFGADAAVARYSKVVAEEMYGDSPHHGYKYGGSGGSMRSIHAMENVSDVWDGSVPHIMPSATTGTFGFSVSALATRVLRPVLSSIVDALDAGGSGDPFEHLDLEQREALTTLYRAGFPRGAEFSLRDPFEQLLVWSWNGPGMIEADPEYFASAFWSAPGYAGADQGDRLRDAVIDLTATVTRVVRASQLVNPDLEGAGTTGDVQAQSDSGTLARGIELEGLTDVSIAPGARIEIRSGRAAGRVLQCLSASRGVLYGMALGEAGNLLFEGVEPGDEVSVSNRDFVAFQYLHRHQLGDEQEYDQFRVDGRPFHPQRSKVAASAASAGRMFTGRFHGKMIIVQNLLDRGTWPMGPVHYEQSAREHFGDDLGDRLRIYYNERAAHLPGSHQPQGHPPVVTTRLIDFQGTVEQAVQDLVRWVEDGVEPPRSSDYEVGRDLEVRVAPRARDRGGIQPSVVVTANGAARADVSVGDEVTFVAEAETPAGTGTIIAARWDWDGTGAYPFAHDVDGKHDRVRLETTHAYTEPGTYFATCRVTAHRDGDLDASVRRCDNLARVRVVVS